MKIVEHARCAVRYTASWLRAGQPVLGKEGVLPSVASSLLRQDIEVFNLQITRI